VPKTEVGPNTLVALDAAGAPNVVPKTLGRDTREPKADCWGATGGWNALGVGANTDPKTDAGGAGGA
jgi:hypothetical protein